MDKAYDSNDIVSHIEATGTVAVIQSRVHRKDPVTMISIFTKIGRPLNVPLAGSNIFAGFFHGLIN